MLALNDKTAIITGSSAGIGKGIAVRFAELGAHVVVTSRTLAQARKVVDGIRQEGGQATPCAFDLEDPAAIPTLLATAADITGRIDILVNNALSRSTMPRVPLQGISLAQLQTGVAANLTNVLALTAAVHPYLQATQGVVLNIGSAVVNRHMLGIPLYTILKGALAQASRVLAAEWAGDGIRVNQINPGFVRTADSLTARQAVEYTPKIIEHFAKLHPIGRGGEVDDIAALAAFLVCGQASWITGAIVDIDGGFSVQGALFPTAG